MIRERTPDKAVTQNRCHAHSRFCQRTCAAVATRRTKRRRGKVPKEQRRTPQQLTLGRRWKPRLSSTPASAVAWQELDRSAVSEF